MRLWVTESTTRDLGGQVADSCCQPACRTIKLGMLQSMCVQDDVMLACNLGAVELKILAVQCALSKKNIPMGTADFSSQPGLQCCERRSIGSNDSNVAACIDVGNKALSGAIKRDRKPRRYRHRRHDSACLGAHHTRSGDLLEDAARAKQTRGL